MEDAFWPAMVTVMPVLVIALGVANLAVPIDMTGKGVRLLAGAVRALYLTLPAAGSAAFMISVLVVGASLDPTIFRTPVMIVAVTLMGTISGHVILRTLQQNDAYDGQSNDE